MVIVGKIIEVWQSQSLSIRTLEHLYMFGIAIIIASSISIGLAIIVYSLPKIAHIAFNTFNVVQTTPALALLVILIPLCGLGKIPTIIASILYAILPIFRNTYAGLVGVNKEYIEVAQSMGLSSKEILIKVRMPLALPLIAAGVRIAIVFTMGIVTLGGLIAAGGLGAPLQTGIHLYDKEIIIITGLWVAILAVVFDFLGYLVEKRLKVKYRNV